MKTDHLVGNNSDPIWASNVELLPPEECLPVIGSCQVSSILQNLDSSNNDHTIHNLQNMDLIILPGNDYKMPLEAPLNLHSNNYIVLKDPIHTETSTEASYGKSYPNKFDEKLYVEKPNGDLALKNYLLSPDKQPIEEKTNPEPTDLSLTITESSNSSTHSIPSPKHYDKESFEDMLYFVCNLCPFLCTKENRITVHLETSHKYKTVSKQVQLKCPACVNIFYHRASLKSHLLHDHCVDNDDLNLIVQAVVFYSNKENKKEGKKSVEEKGFKTNSDDKPINKIFVKSSNSIQTEKNTYDSMDLTKSIEASKTKPLCSYKPENNNVSEVNKLSGVNTAEYSEAKKVKEFVGSSSAKSGMKVANKNDSGSESEGPGFNGRMGGSCTSSVPQNNLTILQKVPLPQVDITPNNSEKLITNLMKKSDPVVKFIHNSQKCMYASCKVFLGDPKKMDYHVSSHLDDGFRCLECQEKFQLWKTLSSHLWRLHKIDMELFSCDKCDYKTTSLSTLKNVHKAIHSNVKNFKCDVCLKSFKNQKQVRNHRRIHRDKVEKELLTCEVCSKTLTDKRRLRHHMDSVHKKLKPFLCNYCGYKGSCRASLKMHIRSHTGEKPFSCDQCAYATADHNSLRRHKLRHSGQKPYKCSFCSYACIQSSTYKVHLKTKHPGIESDLLFECYLCQFRTVNKELFSSHMISEHKETSPVR